VFKYIPAPRIAGKNFLDGSTARIFWRVSLARVALAGCMVAACSLTHAQSARDKAVTGAVGDGVSTAAGMAAGAAEANPLGPVLAIGMKAVIVRYADTLPDTRQPSMYAMAASWWQGATVNNVCITASVVSGGAFAPACVALGIAWGLKTWTDTEHERLFWEGCEMLRRYAQEPELKCIYTPPEKALATVDATPVALKPEDIAP